MEKREYFVLDYHELDALIEVLEILRVRDK
jgi:hypothetical protein